MNLRDTYNRIAEEWHKDHQQDDWWVEGTDTFISLLPPGAEVLDVGCGGGFKAKYISNKGHKVIGIDFSDKLIDIARRDVPEATFEILDMHDVSSMTQMFDGIFAQASLLHIPRAEIEDVLSELVSKLNKGGHLYVAVKGARPNFPLEEVKEENDYGYPYKRFFSYFTPDEIKTYFQNLGLEVVYENVSTQGRTDWVQVIGKKS